MTPVKSRKAREPEYIVLCLSTLDPLMREFTEHGPPIDHRGCCSCALGCGKSLTEGVPVGIEVWSTDGEQLRGTSVCSACAARLRSRALSDSEVEALEADRGRN